MPTIIEFNDSKIFPISGEDFSISCRAQNAPGTPKDITVRWTRLGGLVDESLDGVVSIVDTGEDGDRIATSTITVNLVVNTSVQYSISQVFYACVVSVGNFHDYPNDRVLSGAKNVEIYCKLVWYTTIHVFISWIATVYMCM